MSKARQAGERRRLAAIMFTDMAGYTALGQRNESLALAVVKEQRKLLRPIFKRHNGKEIKTIGDAFLVEFPSALEAARCAYDIQRSTREFNFSLPEDKRIILRIGLHLGDVIETGDGDISGDAVSVASRIEPLAERGGVCLTRQIYDHIQNKFDLLLDSMGMKSLKNVTAPVEVYRMVMPWEQETQEKINPKLDPLRIAVLPFVNMSPDPNDEYFADGMTEELISTISEIGELAVISRTSVMQYKKNASKHLGDIGRDLKVGCIVEGSSRKAGNRVRVAVQLIEVESDRHLWSHSYDANLEDVFSVQSEIARNVADSLRVKLLPKEEARIEKIPTSNPEAHDIFLRGLFFYDKFSEEGYEQAMHCFEQAIELDPKYALAYCWLAFNYLLTGFLELRPPVEAFRKAGEFAEKALILDPQLAEAHISLSDVFQNIWNFADAEKEARRAIELKPNLALGHSRLSILLSFLGKYNESISEARKALALDPKSPSTQMRAGNAFLYGARMYDEAIEHYKIALELNPDMMIARGNLGIAYVQKGMVDDGISEIELTHSSDPGTKSDLAYAYVKAGKKEEARRLLSELLNMREKSEELRAATAIAGIYGNLGEVDKAFEWLERAYEEHSAYLIATSGDPVFDSLQSEPRYQALMKKIRSTTQ